MPVEEAVGSRSFLSDVDQPALGALRFTPQYSLAQQVSLSVRGMMIRISGNVEHLVSSACETAVILGVRPASFQGTVYSRDVCGPPEKRGIPDYVRVFFKPGFFEAVVATFQIGVLDVVVLQERVFSGEDFRSGSLKGFFPFLLFVNLKLGVFFQYDYRMQSGNPVFGFNRYFRAAVGTGWRVNQKA